VVRGLSVTSVHQPPRSGINSRTKGVLIQRFGTDHIPTERHVTEDEQNQADWDSDSSIATATETLIDRWGTGRAPLPTVTDNIDRLALDL
jgi:hypothetical protein